MSNSFTAFCFLIFVIASCKTPQSAGSGRHDALIQRIENEIHPITSSGADSNINQTIDQRMQALKVPGVSIAVFDSGQIIWAKGYGIKELLPGMVVDTNTLFQAASISKPVTAVGMLRLVERNVLQLDNDVNQYLKRWQIPASDLTATEKVTLRRVVSHMSGLGVHGFFGYHVADTIPTAIQILNGGPPANSQAVRVVEKPGTREIYSGGAYTMLQVLLEDVTGKQFKDLLQQEVLQPAGMKQSGFDQPLPAERSKNVAKGFDENAKLIGGGSYVYPEMAAAGLWTTPSDLARFMMNISGCYRGEKGLLKQSTVQEMLTKLPGAGGLGFGVDGSGTPAKRFRHSGGNYGYTCYAVAFTDVGRGIVVMTNSANGTALIRELSRTISRVYGWPPMLNRE
jgi:CubicO group peptidase (beta-lactamase class C family)